MGDTEAELASGALQEGVSASSLPSTEPPSMPSVAVGKGLRTPALEPKHHWAFPKDPTGLFVFYSYFVQQTF